MMTSDSNAPAIQASGLVKRYGKDVVALDGLTFAVEPSTTFGLLLRASGSRPTSSGSCSAGRPAGCSARRPPPPGSPPICSTRLR